MSNWAEIKRIMGTSTSRQRQGQSSTERGPPGCFRRRKRFNKEEAYVKRPVTVNNVRLEVDERCEWDELPTPTSERNGTSSEQDITPPFLQTPNYEKIMQIIRCFPFPSPRTSPTQSPRVPKRKREISRDRSEYRPRTETRESEMKCDPSQCDSVNTAVSRLVQVSVETMAITALPIDCWLKERLKKWVQLSGHEGSIVPATTHTLYKKQASNRAEGIAYEAISRDKKLEGITPKFYREIEKNEESFIEIEDLLQQFADPANTAIMDIKIGTRTFLECEVSNTKLRADLYQKMIAIDPEEPTDEERKRESITKLRYMQFRERESSSAQLGFRIEAAKMPGGELEKNFKKVRSSDDVEKTLRQFFGNEPGRVRDAVLQRLGKMRFAIENSEFFGSHEVVGSSLLLMYDNERVGVWAIDFAKSSRMEPGKRLTHRENWVPGNNEDGYLTGLDNLIQIVEDMCVETPVNNNRKIR